jgi:hypothetical protein
MPIHVASHREAPNRQVRSGDLTLTIMTEEVSA